MKREHIRVGVKVIATGKSKWCKQFRERRLNYMFIWNNTDIVAILSTTYPELGDFVEAPIDEFELYEPLPETFNQSNQKPTNMENQTEQSPLTKDEINLRKWSLDKAFYMNPQSYDSSDLSSIANNTIHKKQIIEDAEKIYNWVTGIGFRMPKTS